MAETKLQSEQFATAEKDAIEKIENTTSTAAELNKLDGASADVTPTNLNTLTAGPSSDADALHTHPAVSVVTNCGETSRSAATASGNEVIAHGLGKTPKQILFFAASTNDSSNGVVDDDMDNSSVYQTGAGGGGAAGAQAIYILDNGSNGQGGQVTAWDDTNFTLAWNRISGGKATYVTWIALA